MTSLVDEVRRIEGKVVEISHLQEIFAEKVLEQVSNKLRLLWIECTNYNNLVNIVLMTHEYWCNNDICIYNILDLTTNVNL